MSSTVLDFKPKTEVAIRRLDVGAGAKVDDGWETMDISPAYHPDFQHDMTAFPWPFEDNTFDEIRCWHVLEHMAPVTMKIDWRTAIELIRDSMFTGKVTDELIGNLERTVDYINTRIAVMNEMWRILKVGGMVNVEVPIFPYWQAIADPTHVANFVPQTFWYFCKDEHDMHRELYGIKTWKLIKGKRNNLGSILNVTMEKVAE